MSISPENLLPDCQNTKEFNGITVRKGTFAAVLANIEIMESAKSSLGEKNEALEMIKKLAPALVAIGVHTHLQWRNPEVQKLFDELVNT